MSKNNKKQLDINKFYYQLASLNTILIILSFPAILLFYYKVKNILLSILILNILSIINFYVNLKFIDKNLYYILYLFIIFIVLFIISRTIDNQSTGNRPADGLDITLQDLLNDGNV